MTLLERAMGEGYEFRLQGPKDFQYRPPSDRPIDLELQADIAEHREELLGQLRADVPKTCAKCGAGEMASGGILCIECIRTLSKRAFDVPDIPEGRRSHG